MRCTWRTIPCSHLALPVYPASQVSWVPVVVGGGALSGAQVTQLLSSVGRPQEFVHLLPPSYTSHVAESNLPSVVGNSQEVKPRRPPITYRSNAHRNCKIKYTSDYRYRQPPHAAISIQANFEFTEPHPAFPCLVTVTEARKIVFAGADAISHLLLR